MVRAKILINNTQQTLYSGNIVREGERAVDISKIEVPSNVTINQNDDVKFMHDIIDLEYLIACYTFEDHVKDESGNSLDGSGTDITFGNNKNNYGRSAIFNGTSSFISVADNVAFDFSTGKFAFLWRGIFYSEPKIFNHIVTTNAQILSGTLISRIGLEIGSGNIGIGRDITKLTMYLSKNNTPTGTARIGIMDLNENVKSETELDVSTLTGSASEINFTIDSVTLEEGDVVYIEYTGGDNSDNVNVHGVDEVVASTFASYKNNPWSAITFNPAFVIGDNGSVDETLMSRRSSGTNGWKLKYNENGTITLRVLETEITSSTSFADGLYHLIYVTRTDAGGLELFIDNTSIGTDTETGDVDVSADLLIGKDYDSSEFYSKKCSQIRFYSQPLTAIEQTRIHTKVMPIHIMWFGGIVWKITKPISLKEAECKSYGKVIGEIEVRGQVFSNTSPEDIVENLISNNTDLTYIDSGSPSGQVLQRYVADGKLHDVIADMARLTNRTWKVDALKIFHFEDFSANTIPVTYTHGTNARVMETTDDDTELVNDLIVLGENKRYSSTELFSGDSSDTTFVVTNLPISTRVLVNGVEQRAEVDFTVDIELKTITFAVAPASGTDNVQIEYEYEKPLYVRQIRQSSIDEHGRRAKRLILPWIKEYADGVRFISSYLNVYSKVRTRMKVEVPTFEHRCRENDVVRIVNAVKAVNDQFLIKTIKWTYPSMVTTLDVGEFSFDEYEAKKQVLEKIHDIESSLTTSKEINEYEVAEETIGLSTALSIGLVEEFYETIVITDNFDVEVFLQGTYHQTHYGNGVGTTGVEGVYSF